MNVLIEATLTQLVEMIEHSDGNWIKEWAGCGMPKNYTTGRAYHGINILLLWSAGIDAQHPTQDWASYKQWQAAGRQVKQGEKSTVIFINKDALKKGGDKENPDDWYRLLKCAFVFNAAQLTEPPPVPNVVGHDFTPLEVCEQTVLAAGPVVHTANAPAYVPSSDVILMPLPTVFDSAAAYYSTMFHELTHWTGHRSRLARSMGSYAEEELVAEFGAAFLCASHGIDGVNVNAAAYIRSWLNRVKREKGVALMAAASAASKASDFITGFRTQLEEGEAMASA